MRNSGDAGKKLSRRVARHELIGLDVEIRSPHGGWDGLAGRIVDETKHTFTVERTSSGPEVMVPKRGQTFIFQVGGVRTLVQGDDIMFQPEDRTKRIKG